MAHLDLLRKLTQTHAPPGSEEGIKDIIKEEIKGFVDEIMEDRMGNLYAIRRRNPNKPTIALAAHMDEVGIMVTHIHNDGFLRFTKLGGVDPRALYAQKIILLGKNGPVRGYIGAMAPHLIKKKEDIRVLEIDELAIDVGATSKEEVHELGIEIGTKGVFDSFYQELTKNRIASKALDDRIGIAAIIKIIKETEKMDGNLIGIFTVQEEVGLRGARSAGWIIEPDYLVVLECTAAGDTPGVADHMQSTRLGQGVAITLADASLIAHPKLVDRFISLSKEKGIPIQFKTRIVGGTDGGAMHTMRGGIPTAVLSVPGRYIHSPLAIADKRDMNAQIELTLAFIEDVLKKG